MGFQSDMSSCLKRVKKSVNGCKVRIDEATSDQIYMYTELFLVKLYCGKLSRGDEYDELEGIEERLVPLIRERRIDEADRIIQGELKPVIHMKFQQKRKLRAKGRKVSKVLKGLMDGFEEEVRGLRSKRDIPKLIKFLRDKEREIDDLDLDEV